MSKRRANAFRRPLSERREPYLRIFLLSFAMMLLLMLPVMIYTKGYFIYYGDFNSQQLPFYYHVHELMQNGSFGWDWQTDLGSNLIGSYSFYLIGSPFFWLTVPFPQEWVLYLIPYLLALKHAIAAVTAFAYIRRFVRSRNAAVIGALLYAFSGFQMYNVFFNHFQDVTAFFPLLLIAMEQRINEERRGVFGLTVALMGFLNYYFFICEVVFTILYFIIRCPAKDFRVSWRKFFGIAIEAVFGTMIACVLLLPSALAVMDNYRVHKHLFGLDMVAYSDRTRVWRIIQSFFMIPDVPARPNLFKSDYGKWSSIAGYLPMFSMAGVIAFMSQERKHWATRLTVVCAFCACVPILNSMFYTFNSSYYARWFYMPILILALMTARALDDAKIRWKGGLIACAVLNVLWLLIAFLPTKDDDGNIKIFDFAAHPYYLVATIAATLLMLYLAGVTVVLRRKKQNWYRFAVWMTVISCLCTGGAMIYYGLLLGTQPHAYLQSSVLAKDEMQVEMPENQLARVDISKDCDNFPMFWGYSNMRCFHSIVPASVMEFYDAVGVQRDVASRAEPKHFPLRELFSVKYYFDSVSGGDAEHPDSLKEMPSFKLTETRKHYRVYENDAYIPMGLAFDEYIDEEAFRKLPEITREKALLRALVLTPEQQESCVDYLTKMPDEAALSDEAFLEYCRTRADETCDSFRYDSKGFDASIRLDAPKMVFFSVPYESGWSATVNGEPAVIEKVDIGFMAVRCGKGTNTIVFRYETPGLRIGFIVMLCGAAGLILYLILMRILTKDTVPQYPKQKHFYDYDGMESFLEHRIYLRHAANKQTEMLTPEPPVRAERQIGRSPLLDLYGDEQDDAPAEYDAPEDDGEPEAYDDAYDEAYDEPYDEPADTQQTEENEDEF